TRRVSVAPLDVSRKGAGRLPRARLCAAEKRSSAGARTRAPAADGPRLCARHRRAAARRTRDVPPTIRPVIAPRLVAWQRRHGRNDLPWQNTRDAYRVWLSEIMLQQTRVSAVVPYFLRFVARFPTIETLAAADEDDVL